MPIITDEQMDALKAEIYNYYRYQANEQNLVDTNVDVTEHMLPPGWEWVRDNNTNELVVNLIPNYVYPYISTQPGYVFNNMSDAQFEELYAYILSSLSHWRNNAITVDGAIPHQLHGHGKRRNRKSKRRRGKSVRRGKSRRGRSKR